MNNAPETIYTHIDEPGCEFASDPESVQWSDMRSEPWDVEYIRADLVPQWQPIMTMPFDVKCIVLHARYYYVSSPNFEIAIRLKDRPNSLKFKSGGSSIGFFTHWMNIPETPPNPVTIETDPIMSKITNMLKNKKGNKNEN